MEINQIAGGSYVMNEKRSVFSIIKIILSCFTFYIVCIELVGDIGVGNSPSNIADFLDYFDIAIVPLLFIILLEIKEISYKISNLKKNS